MTTGTYSFWGTRALCAASWAVWGMWAGLPPLIVLARSGRGGYAAAAMALPVAYAVWRGATVRVVADSAGLTAYNVRTHRIPWSVIERFDVARVPLGRMSRRCPCVVRNDGGRRVKLVGMLYMERHYRHEDARSAIRFKEVVAAWEREQGLPRR
jgi:hypothetical protein